MAIRISRGLLITLAGLGLASQPASSKTRADSAVQGRAKAEYARLPLSFEINQGQTDAHVKALARGNGYVLFLTPAESVLVLSGQTDDPAVLRIQNVGANPAVRVTGVDRLPGTANYFMGNDASKWLRDIPTYSRVKYEDIYPGINLMYYGNQRELEYDFVVSPGADPGTIRFAVQGARGIHVDPDGDLVLETPHGAVRHHRPLIYQEIDGARHQIAGGYLVSGNQVSFQVSGYDHRRELVIDPTLAFLTYLGGSGTDVGKAVAVVNRTGYTIVAGATNSIDFPTPGGVYPYKAGYDGFVTALNQPGTQVLVSSYIGGSGADVVTGVVVDNKSFIPKYIYIAGLTNSTDFPTLNPLQPYGSNVDGFVTKIDITAPFANPIGVAVGFSTYLGAGGVDQINALALDPSSGDVFVTGSTTSQQFPLSNALQGTFGGGATDAFVTRIKGTSPYSLVYSTYLGGAGADVGYGIAVKNGVAYITGSTTAAGFAQASATPDAVTPSQAFVTAISANGASKIFSTVLGASTATSVGQAVAVDTIGNAYITGYTSDPAFATLNALQPVFGGGNDVFIAEFNPSGTLIFSTYWGGAGVDRAYGIALSPSNNVFIAGLTTGNFPSSNTPAGLTGAYGGGTADGFVAMFINCATPGACTGGNAFQTNYSTYFGGNGADVLYGIVVGTQGNARVTGITSSANLPVTTGVVGVSLSGPYDAVVAQITTVP